MRPISKQHLDQTLLSVSTENYNEDNEVEVVAMFTNRLKVNSDRLISYSNAFTLHYCAWVELGYVVGS